MISHARRMTLDAIGATAVLASASAFTRVRSRSAKPAGSAAKRLA